MLPTCKEHDNEKNSAILCRTDTEYMKPEEKCMNSSVQILADKHLCFHWLKYSVFILGGRKECGSKVIKIIPLPPVKVGYMTYTPFTRTYKLCDFCCLGPSVEQCLGHSYKLDFKRLGDKIYC